MEKERGLGWSGEREERSRSESQKEKGGLETRVCRGCHRQAPEAGGLHSRSRCSAVLEAGGPDRGASRTGFCGDLPVVCRLPSSIRVFTGPFLST